MFSKLGAGAIKKDLTNTLELCKRISDPHKRFSSIHIAGTNGKGSVSHMLAAILQVAGYKTGLYTSPHLRDFRERIRLNGEMISEMEVIQFVADQKNNIEEIEPSFFEATVAMAFQYFAENKVDIAIIETGLGGRLDSTNIITPLLSVITNIGLDHTNILGTTLPEIAFEKAGIIKPSIPVVIGERQQEIENVFIEKARKTSSDLKFASDEWTVEKNDEQLLIAGGSSYLSIIATSRQSERKAALNLDLTASYQLKNARTVLSAVDQLNAQGFNITPEHVREALSQVKRLTGLMGRWETLAENPKVICDTGHNEHGIKEVLKNILSTPYQTLHMVIGMVKDKDITKVLSLLPANANYYFCAPDIERAKPAVELAQEAHVFGLKGNVYNSVEQAFNAAKNTALKDDLIFIGGSNFVVAEII